MRKRAPRRGRIAIALALSLVGATTASVVVTAGNTVPATRAGDHSQVIVLGDPPPGPLGGGGGLMGGPEAPQGSFQEPLPSLP